MNNTIKEANDEHKRCQAEGVAFVKAGGKVTVGPMLIRKIDKGTINKKSGPKPDMVCLDGLNPTEKVRAVLTQHKNLTRLQLIDLTGLSSVSITRATRILEDEGFLTRGPAGQGNGREVLFSVVGK